MDSCHISKFAKCGSLRYICIPSEIDRDRAICQGSCVNFEEFVRQRLRSFSQTFFRLSRTKQPSNLHPSPCTLLKIIDQSTFVGLEDGCAAISSANILPPRSMSLQLIGWNPPNTCLLPIILYMPNMYLIIFFSNLLLMMSVSIFLTDSFC